MTKTCGECCGFSGSENRCLLLGGRGKAYADNKACRRFVEKKTKVITNGDKIRQMSNEELAGKFGFPCPPLPKKHCKGIDNIECTECWLNWLNAPAESEGKE